MMPPEFRDYAALWQEQIDPEELAGLQAMAKKIERIAWWKRLLDVLLGLGFVVPVGLILWVHPASPQTKLGYFLGAAMVGWLVWRRHLITRAARATSVHDPHLFFEKTIKNVRAEINLSTISLALGIPAFIFSAILMGSIHGLGGIEFIRLALHEKNLRNTIFVGVILALGTVYFVWDNIKLREQLRRLENMRREWDARDSGEGP